MAGIPSCWPGAESFSFARVAIKARSAGSWLIHRRLGRLSRLCNEFSVSMSNPQGLKIPGGTWLAPSRQQRASGKRGLHLAWCCVDRSNGVVGQQSNAAICSFLRISCSSPLLASRDGVLCRWTGGRSAGCRRQGVASGSMLRPTAWMTPLDCRRAHVSGPVPRRMVATPVSWVRWRLFQSQHCLPTHLLSSSCVSSPSQGQHGARDSEPRHSHVHMT